MKFKLRKLISAVAATAMMAALVPVSFAADAGSAALTINAEGTTNFEIEDFFATVGTKMDVKSNPSASGGSYLHTGWTDTLDDSTKINVLKEGVYTIDFVASRYESYWGGLNVGIDGGAVIGTGGAGTATEITDGDFGALNKYSAPVYLAKGTHTVNLVTTIVNNHIACAIDNISFTESSPVLEIGAENKTFEVEEVWTRMAASTSSYANASGGTIVANGWDSTTLIPDYAKLKVGESGLYKINLVTEESDGNSCLTKIRLTVDDTVVVRNVKGDSSPYTETDITGLVSNMNSYYQYIYLTKGTHVLKINYELSNDNKNRNAYSFDTLSFAKSTTPTATLAENGGKIEAETGFANIGTITDDANASGKKIIYTTWGYQYNDIFPANIDVAKAGFYNIDLYSNKYTDYVSASVMRIDGSEVIASSSENPGTAVGTVYPNADFEIVKHSAADAVYLTAGKHEIEVEFNLCKTGTVSKYAFDYVEFTPYNEAMNFTSNVNEIEPFYLDGESDNTDNITVKLNGEKITNGNYQITYKSSNEKVATVSENGTITAMSAGYTDISVEVGIKNQKVTLASFTGRVYVLDETYDKYISDTEYSGGSLSFTAADSEGSGFAGKAYIAVYSEKKLVNAASVDLTAGQTEYSKELEVKSGETAKIFLWNSDLSPIWFATDVEL